VRQAAAGHHEHPPGVGGPDRCAERPAKLGAARQRRQWRRRAVDDQRDERNLGQAADQVVALHDAVVDRQRIGQRDVEPVAREPIPD
jgi:hypothetical protein